MSFPSPTFGRRYRSSCVFGKPVDDTVSGLIYCMDDPDVTTLTVTVGGVTYIGVTGAPGANEFQLVPFGYAWTAQLVISGLTAFTDYTWSLLQGTETSDGSFTTKPGEDDDYTIWEITCHGSQALINVGLNTSPWTSIGMYGYIKDDALDDTTPKTIAVVHVDDIGYRDNVLITDDIDGTATGLTQSTRISNLCNANDASLALLAYMGALGSESITAINEDTGRGFENVLVGTYRETATSREESYAWCKHNLLFIPSVGDHEYADDTGTRLDVTVGANPRWANYGTKTLGIGQIAYDAFWGNLVPNKSNGGVNDPDGNHWTLDLGALQISAIEPYSHGTGGELSYVPASDTDPTSFVQKTVQLGANMISDTLDAMQSSKAAFKQLFMPVGVRYLADGETNRFQYLSQHPLFNWQNVEFTSLFTDTSGSLMDHKNTNGVNGSTVLIGGDLHHANIQEHRSLPFAGNHGEEFDHWYLGTVNGSTNFDNVSGLSAGDWYESADGHTKTKLVWDSGFKSISGQQHNFAAVRTEVYGSETPKRMVKTMVDSSGNDVYQRQYFQGGGNRSYPMDKKPGLSGPGGGSDTNE